MSAYIFDFDGTLVDSMPYWGKKITSILDSQGISYPDDIVTTLATLGDRGSAEYMQKMGVKLSLDEMFTLMDEYGIPQYENIIPAKETVVETLELLRKKGHSLNILTASPHKMLDPCLKRLGIFNFFDNVWSSDDFGLSKSNPEIYEKVAEKLGIFTKNCIFIDDNLTALKTAKSAGMKVVGVFDESSKVFTREIKSISDKYIIRFDELIDYDFIIIIFLAFETGK